MLYRHHVPNIKVGGHDILEGDWASSGAGGRTYGYMVRRVRRHINGRATAAAARQWALTSAHRRVRRIRHLSFGRDEVAKRTVVAHLPTGVRFLYMRRGRV